MPINFFKQLDTCDKGLITRVNPPENLRPFVEGFYLFESDFKGRHLFFNDGYPVVTLMQHHTSKLQIDMNGDTVFIGNAWVCGGLLKNIYCQSYISKEQLFVVRFNPLAFFKLFNADENIFKHKPLFDLSEIATGNYRTFTNDFYSNSSLQHKVDAVTRFLSANICQTDIPPVLSELIECIEQNKALSVRHIATLGGRRVGYKWLERSFKKHLGLSPKEYMLRKRFLNTYKSLATPSPKALLQTALENGYYDDNHLIKDLKSFLGQPPKVYFKELATFQ